MLLKNGKTKEFTRKERHVVNQKDKILKKLPSFYRRNREQKIQHIIPNSVYEKLHENEINRCESENVLRCCMCNMPITSTVHATECTMITMCQEKYQCVGSPSDFKPMMTFGLGGCTAIIIAIFDTMEACIGVVMAHYPDIANIISTFNKYYNKCHNNRLTIVVKSPADWVKIDGKYTEELKYKRILDTNIVGDNITVRYIPYSETISFGESVHVRSLYVALRDKKLQYTDSYGIWHDL